MSQGKVGNIQIITSSVVAQTVNSEADQQNQVRLLTIKGHEHLEQGQATEALHAFEAAIKLYRKLQNQEGVVGSLVNQSLAFQALGQYPNACKTLMESLQLHEWVCQNPNEMDQVPDESGKLLAKDIQAKPDLNVRVLALHSLGDILRLMGKPNESEVALQQALAMVKRLNPDTDTDNILLSLGNTEQTLYRRARFRLQTTEDPVSRTAEIKLSQSKFRAALDLYQQVSNSPEKGTVLQAQLNRLSLLMELEQSKAGVRGWNIPELKTLQSETRTKIQPLLEQLLTANFAQLPAIQSVYARLNFANSLLQIGQSAQLKQLLFQKVKSPKDIALQFAQEALRVAEELNNIRAESYAFGTIGNIYTQMGQPSQSQQYFEKAQSLAQSVWAWDIAYQWQQQLGRLHQQEGNRNKAIEAYYAAVNSLDQVRGNILSINSDIQFDFREKVEPVYREYMRLLLSEQNPNFQNVIQVNERLQLAELENFLQCGNLDLVSLNQVTNLPIKPTVIYILNLDNQIEVLVQSAAKSFYHYSINAELVNSNIDYLLLNLQSRNPLNTDEQTILSYSQPLYSLLIAPAKEKGYLSSEGTLVFVLDSSLQNLPMSLLHDGKNYLFEHYSIAMALGSQLRSPKSMPSGQRALIAGLSRVSPSFKDPRSPKGLIPLPEVETEVKNVKKNVASVVELLNENFTTLRFQAEMGRHDFPIIHITTHGQFSSDPMRTVLLAWDKLINVQQLNRLLRTKTQDTKDSIELLVLSACETATGDTRSALGIAGVAAQAGARSTVATLWLVDAESTAVLMSEFYKGLNNGLSKAEALRRAQLVLLKTPRFQAPYFWAPFILVGSWL